jgi:hypothetical protein
MTATAGPKASRPKKTPGQLALTTSCTAHRPSAAPAARTPPRARHTRHPAMPISTYSTGQTTPKAQDGGAQAGRSKAR